MRSPCAADLRILRARGLNRDRSDVPLFINTEVEQADPSVACPPGQMAMANATALRNPKRVRMFMVSGPSLMSYATVLLPAAMCARQMFATPAKYSMVLLLAKFTTKSATNTAQIWTNLAGAPTKSNRSKNCQASPTH